MRITLGIPVALLLLCAISCALLLKPQRVTTPAGMRAGPQAHGMTSPNNPPREEESLPRHITSPSSDDESCADKD